MEIRFAQNEDLEQINELRKQVNDLHVKGKPEIFKLGFSDELREYIYDIFRDTQKKIIVCVIDSNICAFAVLHHIIRPENPKKYKQQFLGIEEFGVDETYRRQGIATEIIAFIRDYAKKNDIHRIELNMWEFNQEAFSFYEAVGFFTYQRYMEMKL